VILVDVNAAGTAVQVNAHDLLLGSVRPPRADRQRGPTNSAEVAAPVQPSSPEPGVPGPLLQFQLNQLIGRILAQQDLDPGVRLALLRHLSRNPGRPERALLAHLRDVQEPEDLPPFKDCRKPATQSGGS
jgi:hypothetical protein